MKKRAYFDVFDGPGWPDPADLKPYFEGPGHWEKWFAYRNDSWGLSAEGLDGTAQLEHRADRVDVSLSITGHPKYGATLDYSKWDGRVRKRSTLCSKGDLTRLPEMICSVHGSPLSLGLFIPFDLAWEGVKEFIERDGELPTAIEWMSVADLPPDIFPEPGGDLILGEIFGRRLLRA
jgi:hypothetical protein